MPRDSYARPVGLPPVPRLPPALPGAHALPRDSHARPVPCDADPDPGGEEEQQEEQQEEEGEQQEEEEEEALTTDWQGLRDVVASVASTTHTAVLWLCVYVCLQLGSLCAPGPSLKPTDPPAPNYSGCSQDCGGSCVALCEFLFGVTTPYTTIGGGTGTFDTSTCNAGEPVSKYVCEPKTMPQFNCCGCVVSCMSTDDCPVNSTCNEDGRCTPDTRP